MGHLLGIDIGTSATKTLLCAADGAVVATADAAHPIDRPHPGWSEQDPECWWSAVIDSTRQVLALAGLTGSDIRAVGLSGQMHGSVFLPKEPDPAHCRPVRPALLWNDQRTAAQCDEIEAAVGGRDGLIAMVGNPALTGLTAPKILWVREHEPEHFDRTATVLLPKDFIGYRLTGNRITDVGDGSGTLLLDPRTRNWHGELLARLGLDAALFPPVVESQEVVGQVSAWAAAETGLTEGTPVIAGSGDQMTGAVGTGIVRAGLVSATLGTSGVIFAHAGAELPADPDGNVQVMCAAVKGEYCVYGCMLSAAGCMQWYRDALCAGMDFAQLDAEAALIAPGADGLIFLPYLAGERCPHPNPEARGAWIGLTARHGRGHLTRAVLEGVACAMAEILDLIRGSGVTPAEIRLAGGGAKSPLWRSIQAAMYETPVGIANTVEGSAYGAAVLAGVGSGVWSSVPEACEACITVNSTEAPEAAARDPHREIRRLYASLYPTLANSFAGLHRLDHAPATS